jgi:hypothetical protein
MTVLGSVFLGDAHHHRVFSTTPPTSPPPSSPSRGFTIRAQQARADAYSAMDQAMPDIETSEPAEISPRVAPGRFTIRAEQARAEISPEVTLELRIRWLEALLLGVRQDATKETRKHATEGRAAKEEAQQRESLFRRAEDVRRRLDSIVASNDGLKRFMDHCPLLLCVNISSN